MHIEPKFRVWNGEKFHLEPRLAVSLLNSEPYHCLMATFGRKIQWFTNAFSKTGDEIYEGDLIRFSRTHVKKTYIDHDYKNPQFGEPVTETWIGEVVFDTPTDIDDFYTDEMLGWCVRKVGDGETKCSLVAQLSKHLPNPEFLFDSTYGKVVAQDYEIIGNIFENPELLK